MARIKGATMTHKRRAKTPQARKRVTTVLSQALPHGQAGRYEERQLRFRWP